MLRRLLLCGGLLMASLVLASSAAAATITIGATAPPGTGNGGGCTGCQDFQTSTDAAGPGYAVPAGDGGVITSWSVVSGTSSSTCNSECDAQLLVFRPTGTPDDYTFVGESINEVVPDDGALHTYPTDIVVDPGDVIGLEYYNVVAYLPDSEPSDDQTQEADCSLTIGLGPCGSSSDLGYLMSVSATVTTPSAAFTPSATSVADGGNVSFDGSASSTAATSVTDYDWNFGDGTTLDSGTTATAAHTYTTPGPHTVTLTITDSNGDTNETSQLVTVAAAPVPTAAFSASATSVPEGTSVSFDGSASTSAGTITDYDWNFGDGTTLDNGTTATATHAYTTSGPHTVTLTVTNSYGATNQTSKTVTVLAPFVGCSLSSTTLSATSSGKVTLDLQCPAAAVSSCQGTVALYGTSGTLPTTASAHHTKQATRLGSAGFTITSGGTGVEHITLDSAGKTLLAKKHFSARALISATDGASRTATTTSPVTVKLAVKSTHRHHAILRAWWLPWI